MSDKKSNEEKQKSENYSLAGRWARLFGSLIDAVISLIIIFPVMLYSGYWEKAMGGEVQVFDTALMAVFAFLLFFLTHGYLLAKNGQTVGKKLVGTQIVSASSDKPLSLPKLVFNRYLPIAIASNIPIIGGFLVFLDCLLIFRKDRRCAHDLIAKTKVISIKTR